MALNATTITELNDLAKDYYSSVYINLVNAETPLRAQFSQLEGAIFTGRKWIFGVKGAYGGGAANAGANKYLPKPSQGSFDQGEANVVRTYTSMAIDGLVIEVTKKREGSYRPALAEVMDDRMTAHDLEQNRQLYCGGLGKVAMVKTDSATDQVLEKDYGVTDGGPGARHIYVGDQVEFYDSTLTTQRGTGPFNVLGVNYDTNTVTLNADPVTTAGDVITKATDDTDNVIEKEVNGLLASVSDADDNFETIDTGVVSRWSSLVMSNGGTSRPPSDPLIMQTLATVRARAREMPNLAVTTPGIILKYSEIFLPLRRLEGQDVQLKGGYRPLAAITHGGGAIPVIGDTDCPKGHMFFLNTGAFRMADLVGTDWADLDGAIFDRIAEKDSITGYIRKYWQLITVKRSGNAVVKDLDDVDTIQRQF